jgi:thioredoxin 1
LRKSKVWSNKDRQECVSYENKVEENEMSEKVQYVTDSSFEKDVLQSSKPVLVDFWAEWCAPCRMLAPTLDAVAEQLGENTSTAQRYGIKGIPTLILFSGGKEVERVVGATSKESISRMIEKHVSLVSA